MRANANQKQHSALPYLVLGLALAALMIQHASGASFTSSGALPYDSVMTKIQTSITGPFASLMAVGGIVVAGAALIFGAELNAFFKAMITVVLVISLIVGANNFIALFSGAMIGAPGAKATPALSIHNSPAQRAALRP